MKLENVRIVKALDFVTQGGHRVKNVPPPLVKQVTATPMFFVQPATAKDQSG